MTATPDPQTTDATTPAAGAAYYYLVGARNLCGASAIGQDGAGQDHLPVASCLDVNADTDGDGIADPSDN